jgi:two-component system, OmpR family, sensor histidine kinase BaeS
MLTRLYHSLTTKMILALALINIAGLALILLFARQVTGAAFDQLRVEQAQSRFVETVTSYYETNGSWVGIEQELNRISGQQGQGGQNQSQPPNQQRPPQNNSQQGNQPRPNPPQNNAQNGQQNNPPGANDGLAPVPFLLVDTNGMTLNRNPLYKVGEKVPVDAVPDGTPILFNGTTVGTVYVVRNATAPEPSPLERAFIDRTNRALLLGALASSTLAILIGAIFARLLTSPLRELTGALRDMSSGNLEQEVRINSKDEIGELVGSFNRMSKNLADAVQLRKQMTADVAHELRTPITVMAGYLEAMRDGTLKPNQERYDMLYSEALHLKMLVDDLRILSLADAKELALKRESIDPRAFLEGMRQRFEHSAAQRGVRLEVDTTPALPVIPMDSERMQQVFTNLIGNALRYTPTNGIIRLSGHQAGTKLQLAVEDSGTGIPTENLPYIFERFYRVQHAANNTAPAQSNGQSESGLGLAIARSIVEAHGGSISAESELGKGTAMIITLPLTAPPLVRAS